MEAQWPLILFTTFLAWSAGLFGTQCIYILRGKAAKAQMTALITSFVLLVIGGICVFFHLQHWERIFNGFARLTSGITQELIAIVVLCVIMVIYFVYLRRSGDEVKVPRWLAIVGIVIAALLVIVMSHSYMMASRPAWNNVLQIGSIIGAACGFGPATMAFIAACRQDSDDEYAGKLNIIGQSANAVLTVVYLIACCFVGSSVTQVTYWFDPTSPTQSITTTAATSPFMSSSIGFTLLTIVAVLVAVLAAVMGRKKGNWKLWGAVATVAVFIGAAFLRFVFYQMGISVYPFF